MSNLDEQERILQKFCAERVFLSGNMTQRNYSTVQRTVKKIVKSAYEYSTGLYLIEPIPVGSFKEGLHLQGRDNGFDFIIPIQYKSKLVLQSNSVPYNSSSHRTHQLPIYVSQNRAIRNHPDKWLPVFRRGTKVFVNIEEMMKADLKLYFDMPELQLEEEANMEFYQLEMGQESPSCCKLDPEQILKDFHQYVAIALNPGLQLGISHEEAHLLLRAAVLQRKTTNLLCQAADIQRGKSLLQYQTTVLQRKAAVFQHQITALRHRAASLLHRRRRAKEAAVAALSAKVKSIAEIAAEEAALAWTPSNRSGPQLRISHEVAHVQLRAAVLRHQTITLKPQPIDLLYQAAVLQRKTTNLLCQAADIQRGKSLLQYQTTVFQRKAAVFQHQITTLQRRAAILLGQRYNVNSEVVAALYAKAKAIAELAAKRATPVYTISPSNRSGPRLQFPPIWNYKVAHLQRRLAALQHLIINHQWRRFEREAAFLWDKAKATAEWAAEEAAPAWTLSPLNRSGNIWLFFNEGNETILVKLVPAIRGAIELCNEWMWENLTHLSDWWDGDLTNENKSFLQKVQAIKRMGPELVPKEGFWRLSFSCVEEMILKEVDTDGGQRRAALRLLKFVNQTRWTPEYGKILTSYHLKTLLLWSCEIYPHKEAWETLLSSLKTLLGLLKHTLAQKRLPHYFLKPLNLFNKRYNTSNDIYRPLSLDTLAHEVSAMLADATAYLVLGHVSPGCSDYEEKTAALQEFKERHREELGELKRMEDEHKYEEVETTEE